MGREDETLVLPLKEWRVRRYLSLRKLAGLAGITPETLRRAESGKSVFETTARRIADALGIEPKQVVEFKPTEDRSN